jgi:ATP-dependent DNA ligase
LLKVKIRREARFAVVGLDVPLAGACSLLLASREGRRLIYVGRVEWSVTRATVEGIRERCAVRATPACDTADGARSVILIEPRLVAEVTFSELMQGRLCDPMMRDVRLGRKQSTAASRS